MLTGVLLRSIPLGRITRNAWTDNGIHIVKRSRDNNRDVLSTIRRVAAKFVINSGSLSHDWTGCPVPVFNTRDSIRAISHPVALRRTLGDYIPKDNDRGPHWHKTGGHGGQGTVFCAPGTGNSRCRGMSGDVQQHIDGTEYRVLTVGDIIVQASLKERVNVISSFNWKWVGIDGIRNTGIIPQIKSAVNNIPNWEFTVFGWDIMVDDKPHILEINTSPGVNDASARRIIQQIERVI